MQDNVLEQLIKSLSVLSPEKEREIAAVDLSDIYESSQRFEKLLESMVNFQQNKDDLIDILIEVEIELDHINWHYKSLKKKLKVLMKE
ncbi:TPA: hypothetical protein ACGW7B_001760 [Bacillus nitratireducens]|uniref:hypothetical protein n=1 Tax=Bacillus cereus group TaxID=86661 RepID=UPI0002F11568|nr:MULTISPECIES: hypothetical protein [Bacillus cereus group]EOP57738.1 hypothetical protein IKQ_00688 [Bacillus cereus VDM053]GCF73424.1 hypothetical protein BC2926_09650 [Bacillus cereus]OJD42371.1 hypothetical protein BAU23_21320 [Bacillus nitratireducens]SCA98230.1 Uncharacterized protein BWINRA5_01629 [Bacillus mycoides]SDZ82399.1 hypothetical protein SAMN04488146_101183 [Bacillus nitratireducens]